MACACRVNKEIAKLRKYYGVNNKQQKETNIKGDVEVLSKKIISGIVVVLLFPFLVMLLGIQLITHKGKPIKIGNFVKFRHGESK